MEAFEILLPLALILLFAKLMGLGTHRLGMPAVIGMLVAGILIGVLQFIPWAPLQDALFSADIMSALKIMSKIGVVLIMFSAGLGTDLKKLKQTGVASVVITIFGIFVPMLFGFLVAFLFDYFTPISLTNEPGAIGEFNLLSDLFYGAILTATSVSVTVAVLKELGKLDSKVGTSIVAAAVIDDVIGIIILSVLTGFASGTGENTGWSWFSPNAPMVVIKIVIFFIAAIGLGILLRMLFNVMERKSPHNRRVPIISLAACFLYAYFAEKIFGVADITGAYLAGILLGGTLSETPYVESKVDQMGYLFFSPIFFANIGIANIKMFSSINLQFLAFGAVFVVAALLGKILGCGVGAKITKFNYRESLRVGLGMMVRAEVILICTEKGVACGLVNPAVYPFIILIILISSVLTPVFMKLSYRREEKRLTTLQEPNENAESK
jgi:Kef-type K+ transport system membrane component KefB